MQILHLQFIASFFFFFYLPIYTFKRDLPEELNAIIHWLNNRTIFFFFFFSIFIRIKISRIIFMVLIFITVYFLICNWQSLKIMIKIFITDKFTWL